LIPSTLELEKQGGFACSSRSPSDTADIIEKRKDSMLRKKMIVGPLGILACLGIMVGLTNCEDRAADPFTTNIGEVKGYTTQDVSTLAANMVQSANFYEPNNSMAITIVDREGRILFQGCTVNQLTGQSLQSVASAANLATINSSASRALTASYLSSEGEIFSTETAFFIIQENFPPGTRNEDVGPLFGVENSSFVASDIIGCSRFDIRDDVTRADPSINLPARNLVANSNEVLDVVFQGTPNFPHPSVTGATGTIGSLDIGRNATSGGLVGLVQVLPDGSLDASSGRPGFKNNAHVGGVGVTGALDFENGLDVANVVMTIFGFDESKLATHVFVDGVRFQFGRTNYRRIPPPSTMTLQQLVAANLVHVVQGPRTTLQTNNALPFDFNMQVPPQAYVLATQQTVASAIASPEAQGQGITDPAQAAKLFGVNLIATSANKVTIDLFNGTTLLGDIKDGWRPSPNQAEDPGNLDTTRDFRQVPSSSALDLTDVSQIIRQAAETALAQRAGIRRPLGLNAVVHITVCDQNGINLGSFAMIDATVFSYDVAFQKGRGCAFWSDDQVAWAARSIGWVAQPHFPPGIERVAPGPCFGIQALYNPLGDILHPAMNGFQVFPGGLPLYQNGIMVGAIGISGDGVDQDDQISFGGSTNGFTTPGVVRVDVVPDHQKVASLSRVLNKMLNATLAAQANLNAQAPLNSNQQATLASLASLDGLLRFRIAELANPGRLTNVPIPWFKFARAPLLSKTR
jgi:uncharacterized protein GlcG (DUF336 family)